MALRQDGRETRARLLEAACEVFAEKGYAATKIAEVCRRAKANVASVNYYFGSKKNLYIEAWKHAFIIFAGSGISLSKDTPAEQRFSEYIHTIVRGFGERGVHGQFIRLYLMELVNPTGLVHELWHELIEPKRRVFLEIISDLLDTDSTDQRVLFCELSVVAQCRAILTTTQGDLEYLLGDTLTGELVERLADHITRFSLAGIRAMKNQQM